MVVWVTGLSGAGKTTVCSALYQRLKPSIPELVLLDGDIVRRAFGQDLTHSIADRRRQVHRLQGMSKVLVEQGLVVIVAVLYSSQDLLSWNRENLPNYFEVYLKTSMELVRERDNKDLYARAFRGEMPNVVGVDIDWIEPTKPDLEVDMDRGYSPEQVQDLLLQAVPRFRALQDNAGA